MRQSKRMSVTALYLSMSARDEHPEIEDDLAKGKHICDDLTAILLILPQLRRSCES